MTKYFRSRDVTDQCPVARAGTVYPGPVAGCPCGRKQCHAVIEPVSWWEAFRRQHRTALLLGGSIVAAIILLALVRVLFGEDPVAKDVRALQEKVSSLDQRLLVLESKPTPITEDPLQVARQFATRAKELADVIDRQISGQDIEKARSSLQLIEGLPTQFDAAMRTVNAPAARTGELTADAQQLISEWEEADGNAQALRDKANGKGAVLVALDQASEEIQTGLGRTRRLLPRKPKASVSPAELTALRSEVNQSLQRARELVGRYVPPAVVPFNEDRATLVVLATSDLAENLLLPLFKARSDGEVVAMPERHWYYSSKPGIKPEEKIIVKAVSEAPYQRLIEGGADLVLTDLPQSPEEVGAFEKAFPGQSLLSRAYSEVVALDALTLLAHPNSKDGDVSPGEARTISWVGGATGSVEQAAALRLGFQLNKKVDNPEHVVLANPDARAIGIYHKERGNIRAKRLAYKPGPDVLALKPSPFTIATEDYKFSFRVVASHSPRSRPAALELVRFMTSGQGQDLIGKQGYVNLALRPSGGEVDPRILAVLARALNLNEVKDAVRLSTNFRFVLNSKDLDIKALADLERLPIEVAREYPKGRTVILGFTDSSGGPTINMPLSIDRATAVAGELKKAGMNVASAGMADQLPVDSNDTPEGAARNRRAEVWVVP